jgi:nucleoside-diphosphate-sugar epimerase
VILVTGATGFLGAHLVCNLLKQGKHVKALRRLSSDMSEYDFIYKFYFPENPTPTGVLSWAESDILDVTSLEQAMQDVDEVYHCAAIVSFHQKDKHRMVKANEEGTANLVNCAIQLGIKKFCHVSSIAAIGRSNTTNQVDERTRWVTSNKNSNYAISKYKAEMQAWRGLAEGLNTVVVNPGVIIGPCKWNRGTGKLFEMVWNQLPFYTHGVNGYVDVRDVVKAMILLMENNCFGERFILVGHNMENKYFMHTCADLMGRRKAFIRINPFLATCAWIFSALASAITRKPPFITRETAKASLNRYFYSTDKIRQRLSFEFTPIDKTLQYICNHFIQTHTS